MIIYERDRELRVTRLKYDGGEFVRRYPALSDEWFAMLMGATLTSSGAIVHYPRTGSRDAPAMLTLWVLVGGVIAVSEDGQSMHLYRSVEQVVPGGVVTIPEVVREMLATLPTNPLCSVELAAPGMGVGVAPIDHGPLPPYAENIERLAGPGVTEAREWTKGLVENHGYHEQTTVALLREVLPPAESWHRKMLVQVTMEGGGLKEFLAPSPEFDELADDLAVTLAVE